MRLFKILIFISPLFSFSQSDSNLRVYLKTDINYASSASDNRKESQSAVGTLGIKFDLYDNIFASSVFTVHSQNQEIVSDDVSEEKLFGTNLLLPQNSSSDISNFELQLGIDSYYNLLTDVFDYKFKEKKSNLFIRPIGTSMIFRINNTVWEKPNLEIPITIASLSIDITYRLLDAEMAESNERVKLVVSTGYTNRRLGGDYGLEQNKNLRNNFLGTDRLSFDGFKFSTRLEISKFYGQFDLTTFGKKNSISGFSGDQAIIIVGIRADLPISTKVKKYIK
jgi:hypothetical protein